MCGAYFCVSALNVIWCLYKQRVYYVLLLMTCLFCVDAYYLILRYVCEYS